MRQHVVILALNLIPARAEPMPQHRWSHSSPTMGCKDTVGKCLTCTHSRPQISHSPSTTLEQLAPPLSAHVHPLGAMCAHDKELFQNQSVSISYNRQGSQAHLTVATKPGQGPVSSLNHPNILHPATSQKLSCDHTLKPSQDNHTQPKIQLPPFIQTLPKSQRFMPRTTNAVLVISRPLWPTDLCLDTPSKGRSRSHPPAERIIQVSVQTAHSPSSYHQTSTPTSCPALYTHPSTYRNDKVPTLQCSRTRARHRSP